MLYREIIAVCSQIHTKHINTVRTAQQTLSVSVVNPIQLMLYREIIAVCSQIHTKHINTVRTAQQTLSVSVVNPIQLMLYSEINAVCSQIHTKHTNTLFGQNVELLRVHSGGTYSDHWAAKG
jgi:uncharacterized protein YaaW (UPF0174 family)